MAIRHANRLTVCFTTTNTMLGIEQVIRAGRVENVLGCTGGFSTVEDASFQPMPIIDQAWIRVKTRGVQGNRAISA